MPPQILRVRAKVHVGDSRTSFMLKTDRDGLYFNDELAMIYKDENVARHVAYLTIIEPGVDIDLSPLKNLGFFANSILRAVDLLNEASQPFVNRELFAITQEQMQPRSRLIQLNGVRLVAQPED